jgi:DNA-binding NarL/FixJ family response regulator
MTKKLCLILADDDPDDRELFASAMLEVDQQTKLITVEDGESLFRELKIMQPAPDVIFLDLNMPRKNGRECLAEIHQEKAYDSIAVVIYSTSMSPQEMEDAWSLGAACLIRKPDSYTSLKDILRQVLQINFGDLTTVRSKKLTFNL